MDEVSKKCPFCGSDQLKGNLCTYCGREIDRKPSGPGKIIAAVVVSFIGIGVITMVMASNERKLAASERAGNESDCKKGGVTAPDLLASCSQSRSNAETVIKRQTERDCEGAGANRNDKSVFDACVSNPTAILPRVKDGTVVQYLQIAKKQWMESCGAERLDGKPDDPDTSLWQLTKDWMYWETEAAKDPGNDRAQKRFWQISAEIHNWYPETAAAKCLARLEGKQ